MATIPKQQTAQREQNRAQHVRLTSSGLSNDNCCCFHPGLTLSNFFSLHALLPLSLRSWHGSADVAVGVAACAVRVGGA